MGRGERKQEVLLDEGSSGEEDGDEEWKAAINAVANGFSGGGSIANFGFAPASGTTSFFDLASNTNSTPPLEDHDDYDKSHPQTLKHYQLKAQKALDDILEKMLVVVKDPTCAVEEDHHPVATGGVRLFKDAPPGILFDKKDELQRPRKKPRILPGEETNEKSKKFRRQLQSVAVDGMHILAAAKDASRKSLARMEAKEAAAKEAARREEERVAELKRIRGERWLPSIAREMRGSAEGS
ncbi:hypothetical protein Ancab_025900 [Ancistrocladus abbreviatus]